MRRARRIAQRLEGTPLAPLAPRVERLILDAGRVLARASQSRWKAMADLRGRMGAGIEHLHGPRTVETRPGELVVLTVSRNPGPLLDPFLAHHRRLGASRFMILDNGSTDGSPESLATAADVTLFRSELPFRRYGVALRRWLMDCVRGTGWVLYCDDDEHFDYPFSDRLPLSAFLEYLDRNRFTAVAAQMLDLFAPGPVRSPAGDPEADPAVRYPLYDLDGLLHRRDNHWLAANQVTFDQVVSHTGGMRSRVFGLHDNVLTKHPLTRRGAGVRAYPLNAHFVENARIADVTAVLKHYMFTAGFFRAVVEKVERAQHYAGSRKYKHILEVCRADPELTLEGPGMRRLDSVDQLLDDGFLVASQAFRRYVVTAAADDGNVAPRIDARDAVRSNAEGQ